jgi:hypothetical protein
LLAFDLRFIFTDHVTDVTVAADHDDDFQMLLKWADSVRPK